VTPLLPWELILIAHDLTSTDWPELGLHLPKSLLESSEIPEERIIHGLVALLLIRIVALVRSRATTTTTVPVHVHQHKFASTAADSLKKITKNEQLSVMPPEITSEVYAQLYQFVSVIAREYRIEPKYHNLYHAFHVTICCNKLLSILIEESIRASEDFKKNRSTHGLPPTFDAFGLASDPLAQLALIFSAIIHDVDHRGITNQQLVLEGDELAIMYNDQSVAEQRSISLAFSELMRSKHSNNNASMKRSLIKNEANAVSDDECFVYGALRNLIFCSTSGSSKYFLSFRRMVIDLVLTTDIANPERVQIVKSKYKEAFGANASSSAHPPKVLTSNMSSPDKASRSKAPFAEQQQKIPELSNSIRSTTIDVGSSTNSRERKKSLRQEFLESRGSARLTRRGINASSSDEEGHYSSSVPSSSAEDEVQLLAEGKANRNSMMSSFSSRSSMVTSSMKSSVNGAMRRKRRFSAPVLKATYECRLGILRALNLTGSTVTLFSSHTSDDEDEDLQLKVGVLMELILKSADVSNMLQGWDIYLKWSKRLFMEFCEAFEAGRGVDPRPGWFENQITFIDSYGMLLAKHLNEVKVFGAHGVKFIDNIQEIRRRWLMEGGEIVEDFMREWIMTRLAEQVADNVHVK